MRVRQIRMPIISDPDAYLPRLVTEIDRGFDEIVRQLNGVSEGSIGVHHGATTAAPTTGDWARGDFIKNSEPEELGSAASKYVVMGWICTVGGTPGTWLPCRVLTGN